MTTKTRSARALGAIAAAAVTIGVFASTADARVPGGPRLDSVSVACGKIQDDWDALKAKRDKATTADAKAEYQRQMDALVNGQWNGPCSAVFGSIAANVRRPGGVAGGLDAPLERQPVVKAPKSDLPVLQLAALPLDPSTAGERHTYIGVGTADAGAVAYPG